MIEESQGNAHKESLSSFATRTASSWAKFRNKVLSAPSSAHYLTNPEFHVQDLELCVLETLLKGRSYFEHKNQKIHLKAHKDAFLVNMDVALFQESLKWILLHLADCTPESSKIELEVLALNSKDSFKLGEELIRDQLIVGDFSRLVIRDLSGGLAFPNKPLSDSYAGERNESINLNLAWRAWVKHEMRWSWTKKDALGSVFYLDFNSKGARWEADINRCQKLREVFFHGASLEDVIGGELKDPDLARDLTAKKTTFNHLSQSAFELRAPLRGNQGKDKREKASSSVHSTAFSLAGETNSEVSK